MSDYGNYSSDDGSGDDIGLPKTPGAPLNANHSDSDENDSSRYPVDRRDSDDSDSGSDRESSMRQRQQQRSNQSDDDDDVDDDDDDDDDDSSQQQKSSSNENSWDGQQRRQPSNDFSSSSDQGSDRENENRKEQSHNQQRDSGDDDSEDEDRAESHESNDNKRKVSSDSESESDGSEKITKKRKALIDSSEDSNNSAINQPKPEDLFGELSDEDDMDTGGDAQKDQSDEEVDDRQNNNRKINIDDDEEDENDNDDDEEDGGNNFRRKAIDEIFGDNDDERENLGMDEEDGPIPETRIEVEIPRITANLGDNIHFVKLPNFLSIDTHPYDPQWYEDEIDEDEVHDDEGRARLKLKVENTIRWRNVVADDGSLQKESNARVVKWSDGSMSLHLGDEIFDIQTFNLLPGENNHLFIRQGTGLQGQSVFKTKLTFRPFSTESFTHRKLTLSLADRSQKTQKICVIPNVGKDPEAHRSEMIKKEEVKLKQSIRKENKPKRMRDRSFNRGLHSGYDLDDEDDESISIAKIKNQYKRGSNYPNSQYDGEDDEDSENGDEDDDDSDLDIFEKKKSGDKKKIVDSDDEEDDDDEEEDDED